MGEVVRWDFSVLPLYSEHDRSLLLLCGYMIITGNDVAVGGQETAAILGTGAHPRFALVLNTGASNLSPTV